MISRLVYTTRNGHVRFSRPVAPVASRSTFPEGVIWRTTGTRKVRYLRVVDNQLFSCSSRGWRRLGQFSHAEDA